MPAATKVAKDVAAPKEGVAAPKKGAAGAAKKEKQVAHFCSAGETVYG